MTEVSLSTAIFGTKEGDKEGSLSNLFSTNSTLPEKPNNVNFPETPTEKARRERNEEKKKKKRKKTESKGDANSEGDKDEAATTKDIETDVKKRRKIEKDNDNSAKKNDDNENKTELGAENKDVPADGNADTKDGSSEDQEDRTIFVGNLPLETTRRSLESLFRDCGKIKSSRLRSFGTAGVKVAPEHAGNQNLVKKVSVNTKQFLEESPKNTAQGYVVFEKVESVEKALKKNNQEIPNSKGLRLRVDRSKPTMDSTRSVFVGGLPYKANETTLRSHFCNGCGWDVNGDIVEGVRVVRDKESMQCKGFGYVLLKDKSYVPQALEMHESKYLKREIRVLVCGKRFKNRKGAPKEGSTVVLSGAHRRVTGKTTLDKSKKILSKKTKDLMLGTKDKKKRGLKKKIPVKAGNAGISKRAASEKKLDKRAKKIQKRMQKGMGKTKK